MSLLPHTMYFVGIICPPEIEELVLKFKNWMKEHYRCIVALKSPSHLTLVPPFWCGIEKETELLETIQSFQPGKKEWEIRLNGFSHFINRVIFIDVVENPDLLELRNRAEEHFQNSFGELIKKDERPYRPHVTIANRDLSPGDFEKAWPHFSKMEFSKSFTTKQVSLLKLKEGKWEVIGATKTSH